MIASAFPTNLSRSGASGWKLGDGHTEHRCSQHYGDKKFFHGWAPFLISSGFHVDILRLSTLILFTTKALEDHEGFGY